MQTTEIDPTSMATLSPETATSLLWAMSWCGVSNASSTHIAAASPTDTCYSMVDEYSDDTVLRSRLITPARVHGLCRAALRYWWRTVKRKRNSADARLDQRMVRIKFVPLVLESNSTALTRHPPREHSFVRLVCAHLPTSDNNCCLARPEINVLQSLLKRNRADLLRSDTFASAGWHYLPTSRQMGGRTVANLITLGADHLLIAQRRCRFVTRNKIRLHSYRQKRTKQSQQRGREE